MLFMCMELHCSNAIEFKHCVGFSIAVCIKKKKKNKANKPQTDLFVLRVESAKGPSS